MYGTRKELIEELQKLRQDEIVVSRCWSTSDIIDLVRATEDAEPYLTEQQAAEILELLNKNGPAISEERMENAAILLFGSIPETTEVCSICGQPRRADTMHLHGNGWIGHDCCWDDRLHASE